MGSLVAITSPVYWDRDYGAGFSFLYLLTTQMLGFGFAGLARRWLVYPGALIWPSSLSSTVLFRALHEQKQDNSPANGWTITRYRFFAYFTLFAFFIFWFPDYLWTSLSTFAFITWIWPHSQKVNTIFGMNSGLGLLPISFDWTQIIYAGSPGSPLTTPFYITCNAYAVVAFFYLFLSPILYYTNVWNSGYLPLLSSSTFDNTGSTYNITRVVDENLNFVQSKYEAYSPMYISMSYSLTYGLSFAAVTAMVVHTYLYNGSEIWAKFKNSRHGGEDIHRRLMHAYPEVPDWWYGALTVIIVGLGIFTVRYWDSGLPVWGFIVVCCGMGVVLIIPEGILEGTTNQRIFLNIITELIAGYAWPGKPIANMMVKFYGYNSVKHGMDFAQDLKLGQYMKIPPRVLFIGQVYASVLATMTQTGGVYLSIFFFFFNISFPRCANESSPPLDDGPHPRPMFPIQQATFHLQRLQSRLQCLHDLGNHRTPADVSVRSGLQCPDVLFHHRPGGNCPGVFGVSETSKQLDQMGQCANFL